MFKKYSTDELATAFHCAKMDAWRSYQFLITWWYLNVCYTRAKRLHLFKLHIIPVTQRGHEVLIRQKFYVDYLVKIKNHMLVWGYEIPDRFYISGECPFPWHCFIQMLLSFTNAFLALCKLDFD